MEPVVGHLVVVPLDVLRDLGVESPDVLVHQVVAVVAAILLERLRDLRLGLGHEVLPRAAPGEVDLGLEGAVGVDHVAAVDEEVRLEAAHHLVEPHATPRGVDPPALTGGVPGPHERHVAAVHGRRPEAPDHGHAGRLHVAEVEERHPVEDVLARRQAGERHLRGVACLRQRRGAHDAPRVLEALGGGVFDEQAGRAVRRAPHDRPLGGDLAGLHAEGQGRARGSRRLGGRAAGPGPGGDQGAAGGECAAEEPAAAWRARIRHGGLLPAPRCAFAGYVSPLFRRRSRSRPAAGSPPSPSAAVPTRPARR